MLRAKMRVIGGLFFILAEVLFLSSSETFQLKIITERKWEMLHAQVVFSKKLAQIEIAILSALRIENDDGKKKQIESKNRVRIKIVNQKKKMINCT